MNGRRERKKGSMPRCSRLECVGFAPCKTTTGEDNKLMIEERQRAVHEITENLQFSASSEIGFG